ncbi:MAG: HNH endonuclease [Kangiellaceae bacterium]|nr:HNH endonuclease [Kangiellaceae bacterium]
MQTKILRLNKAGQAMEWIGMGTAACLYAKGKVLWTYGDESVRLHGGHSRMTGNQTILDMAPVIATNSRVRESDLRTPRLCNASLFKRDRDMCLYCGVVFSRSTLTCDHIQPRARGGKNSWVNFATACKPCNNRKGCRTPEEANMPLLAVPYKPNKAEYLAFCNRNIFADQMDFLTKEFSNNMRY